MADPIQTVENRVLDALADRAATLVTTLWDSSLGLVASCFLLSRNAEDIDTEVGKLLDLKTNLTNRAEDKERWINQLSGWMRRTEGVLADVTAFKGKYQGGDFRIGGFGLRYDAAKLLRQVKKLNEKGLGMNDLELYASNIPPVELVPSDASRSTMVDADERLREIEDYFQDDSVRVIGIYGMGGVGKTTLLAVFNNELLKKEANISKFNVAIWVNVSKDAILETIAKRLRLQSNISRDDLIRKLSMMKVVLLLDDVWEDLDFELVSQIPTKQSIKIMFTTRCESICGDMMASTGRRVKVGPLNRERSWELFCSNITRHVHNLVVRDTQIELMAKKVADRCGGLPKYLIAVAKIMANAKTEDDWSYALHALDQFPMEEHYRQRLETVLESLKRSYDRLPSSSRLRDCFLYCALFPNDYAIPKDLIVDYWFCEGFLDLEDFDENYESRRSRGSSFVKVLKEASLLENAGDDSAVKLHSAVWNMARRVANDQGFVVLAGNANRIPKSEKWRIARRISFVDKRNDGDILSSYWDLISSELTTLLLRDSVHAEIVNREGFLRERKKLKVLDLKGGGLQEFPAEIPSLSSLQYLDLSDNPSLTHIPRDCLAHVKILRPRQDY